MRKIKPRREINYNKKVPYRYKDIEDEKIRKRFKESNYRNKILVPPKIKVVTKNEKGLHVPLSLVVVVIYFFVLQLGVLSFYSENSILNREIIMKTEIKNEIYEELRNLEITLSNSYSFNTLKIRAEEELKMSKPQQHQIVYIKKPKKTSVNYTGDEVKRTWKKEFIYFFENILRR